MDKKKSFKVYYLLICEGPTEFNLFAYLTRNKFRELFDKSNIKFSDKVEVVEAGVSQGRLNGAGHISHFKSKYDRIKQKYSGQKLFFVLDKDLDDSLKIEAVILSGGDIVQFLVCNSEHLLLKLSGKNPKNPSDFSNMTDFRAYCKIEFKKHFHKKASDLKDSDFNSIFGGVSEGEIRASFNELFSTLS